MYWYIPTVLLFSRLSHRPIRRFAIPSVPLPQAPGLPVSLTYGPSAAYLTATKPRSLEASPPPWLVHSNLKGRAVSSLPSFGAGSEGKLADTADLASPHHAIWILKTGKPAAHVSLMAGFCWPLSPTRTKGAGGSCCQQCNGASKHAGTQATSNRQQRWASSI